jgi:Ca-activated chloride channel family protein
MMWAEFHFLRPIWLLALLPVAWVVAQILRSPQRSSSWRSAVDPHLLGHLMLEDERGASRWPIASLTVAWIATCLALAGPTWERQPAPPAQTVEPIVIALDMSASMEAADVSPSRLARARHKIQDILERQAGGSVALVLFGEEPFVAVPLTDDGRVIGEMLPLLRGDLIPDLSSRPDRAIDQGRALLAQAGMSGGQILLLGDSAGADPEATIAAATRAAAAGRRVSVLGIGTEEGAPVPDGRGRLLRGASGQVMTAPLDRSGLHSIAAAGGGRMAVLEAGDGDLRSLLEAGVGGPGILPDRNQLSGAGFDRWKDAGALLAWVPLLLAPFAFRRGLLAAWILGWTLLAPPAAQAGVWRDLWQTPDQQGAQALARGDATAAADLFESPSWRAAAHYESGDFAAAEAAFEGLPGLSDRYNHGNALARAGRLEDAMAVYDGVLAEDPDHPDARFNRDLVERLLEKSRPGSGESGNAEQAAGDPSQDGDQSSGDPPRAGEQSAGDRSRDGEQGPQRGAKQGERATDEAAKRGERATDEAAKRGERATDEATQRGERATDEAAQRGERATDEAAQRGERGTDEGSNEGQQHADAAERGEGHEEEPAEGSGERAKARAGGADERRSQAEGDSPSDRPQRNGAGASGSGDETPHRARSQEVFAEAAAEGHFEDEVDRALAAERISPSAEEVVVARGPEPVSEEQQAREQMLRRVPDDPAGLLRARIQRAYAQKRFTERAAPGMGPGGNDPWR